MSHKQSSLIHAYISQLVSLGFTVEDAEAALEVNDNSFEEALKWLQIRAQPPKPIVEEIPANKIEENQDAFASIPTVSVPTKKASVRKKSIKDCHFITSHANKAQALQCINKIIQDFPKDQANQMLYYIKRYLEEFMKEPWEEKKQRIKMGNKIFKERVLCEQSLKLFEYVGFYINSKANVLHCIMPVNATLIMDIISVLNEKGQSK
jgi:hypothetical protein